MFDNDTINRMARALATKAKANVSVIEILLRTGDTKTLNAVLNAALGDHAVGSGEWKVSYNGIDLTKEFLEAPTSHSGFQPQHYDPMVQHAALMRRQQEMGCGGQGYQGQFINRTHSQWDWPQVPVVRPQQLNHVSGITWATECFAKGVYNATSGLLTLPKVGDFMAKDGDLPMSADKVHLILKELTNSIQLPQLSENIGGAMLALYNETSDFTQLIMAIKELTFKEIQKAQLPVGRS